MRGVSTGVGRGVSGVSGSEDVCESWLVGTATGNSRGSSEAKREGGTRVVGGGGEWRAGRDREVPESE